ncbi:transcriptional regulator-like protein [Nitrosopumilus sp. K4]|uniref:transcriptional regulator-like protein n=1 Tax=Nitrosopumilus sp. K4 TaxID=2795383 RepID=UPI0020132042|nr:transcriptional regulator-like protein [Nitrosopumilus sp. K4]
MQNSVLGDLIGKKTKGLEFLIENEQYFSNHNFGDIPEYMLSQIECFENCSLLNAVWSTHTSCKNIIDDAEDFIFCIFTQPPFLLADAFSSKIESGINLKILFGKNSDIPDCNDLVDKLQLDKPKLDTGFEKRMCSYVAANVILSDSGACLMLPDNKDMTDIIMGIKGNDKPFLDWCNSFFEYKWNAGEQFARLR